MTSILPADSFFGSSPRLALMGQVREAHILRNWGWRLPNCQWWTKALSPTNLKEWTEADYPQFSASHETTALEDTLITVSWETLNQRTQPSCDQIHRNWENKCVVLYTVKFWAEITNTVVNLMTEPVLPVISTMIIIANTYIKLLSSRYSLHERKWKWSRSVVSDSLLPHGL